MWQSGYFSKQCEFNEYRKGYPTKYTCSKVLDHKEPVPTVCNSAFTFAPFSYDVTRSSCVKQSRTVTQNERTRYAFFLMRLKLSIVYAFVPLLFIAIILLFQYCLRNKRINCVTADKSKICIRYVALITVNFDPQMPPMKASTGHYFEV